MTTSNLLIKYPLDLTGLSPDNLVTNEPHVAPREQARGFGLNYGGFYTKSLRIVHTATGRPLVKGEDYICLELIQRAFEASGQEVCAAVQITNDQLDGEFLVTYQAVGGEFSTNVDVINALLAALALDNRPVKWGDLIGLPDGFPPEDHYHTPDDLYGFEYLIEALERVRSAIMLGDYYDHDEIRLRIENLKKFLLNEDQKVLAELRAHLEDRENPHGTTAEQVGLGYVQNYPVASQPEAEAGNANDRYMTALRVAQAIKALVGNALLDHINNTNNPHRVTADQVGLGLVSNFAVATQTEAENGTSNSVYMTALRVAQAIKKTVGDALSSHINNTSNPHDTTAEQVGLGLVSNYATATATDLASFATNKFMTPAMTKTMVNSLVANAFTEHVNNTSNPHQTTAEQIGLGKVSNFAVATQTEAETGESGTVYMTAQRVKQAINKIVGDGWIAKSQLVNKTYGFMGVYNHIPYVNSAGQLSVGRYIEFFDTHSNAPQAAMEIRLADSVPAAVGTGRGAEFYISGYLNCIDTYHRSDIRDKVDIEELSLDRANRVLRDIGSGITYGLVSSVDQTAGLSAQQVLKCGYSEAIVTVKNDRGADRLAIRDGAMIGLLVSGYNYQSKQLSEQQAKLETLETELTTVKNICVDLAKCVEALKGS